SELQATYVEIERRARRRAGVRTAAGFVGLIIVGAIGYVFSDRAQRIRIASELPADAPAAIDRADYERAMRLALTGLPIRDDRPWALTWSDPQIGSLQAILAGAAQMSALRSIIDERAVDRAARLTSVAINSDGTRIVTASEAGTSAVYELPA